MLITASVLGCVATINNNEFKASDTQEAKLLLNNAARQPYLGAYDDGSFVYLIKDYIGDEAYKVLGYFLVNELHGYNNWPVGPVILEYRGCNNTIFAQFSKITVVSDEMKAKVLNFAETSLNMSLMESATIQFSIPPDQPAAVSVQISPEQAISITHYVNGVYVFGYVVVDIFYKASGTVIAYNYLIAVEDVVINPYSSLFVVSSVF